MRIAGLITGILMCIAGVLFLTFAALNLSGRYRVYDGTPELYKRMHRRMVTALAWGIGFAVGGAVCLFVFW